MSESAIIEKSTTIIKNLYPDASQAMCYSLICGAVHHERQRQMDQSLHAAFEGVAPEELRAVLEHCTEYLEAPDQNASPQED